tara:strand:- start:3143 stop:5275 length:2133 start_codon:yes stop_codon:yes gene_type:complete
MAALHNSGPSTFTSAARDIANLTTGDNGALLNSTSGNVFIDWFTNMNRTTTQDVVNKAVDEMVAYAKACFNYNWTLTAIADLFKFWAFKRGCRGFGEGHRDTSHYFLLRLYDYYPDTVCRLIEHGCNAEYGYWGDLPSIIRIINSMCMRVSEKYRKYNPLVLAMRTCTLEQRSADIKALDEWCKSTFRRSINKVDVDEIINYIKDNGTTNKPRVSLLGRWLVREKSAENATSYWYIGSTESPIRVKNVSFMVRALIKKRDPSGKGDHVEYPVDRQIPYGALKNYRRINSRLSAASCTIEQLMAADMWDHINPADIPSVAKFRLRKALLNEKLKLAPSGSEEDTGNRDPYHLGRIACRKAMREQMMDPSKIKTAGLVPHQIACESLKAQGTAQQDLQNAMWESKVIEYRERIEKVKADIAREISERADSRGRLSASDQQRLASIKGNFLAVPDVSGSMTWERQFPNRPYDIACGLTRFLSSVASPAFRDIAISFSASPTVIDFRESIGGGKYRPMSLKSSMEQMTKGMGYNTDVMALHRCVLNICKSASVPEEDIPTIVIFSDGEFDSQCSSSMSGYDTTHKNVVKMWAKSGYKRIPTIVYWNLSTKNSNKGTQTTSNYPGVIFLQGNSPSLFDLVLYGEAAADTTMDVMVDGEKVTMKVSSVTPEQTFRTAMDKPDFYSHVISVLNESDENELSGFYQNITPDEDIPNLD